MKDGKFFAMAKTAGVLAVVTALALLPAACEPMRKG
jgi:predicted small secreted protein